jgi:hypothetical protein
VPGQGRDREDGIIRAGAGHIHQGVIHGLAPPDAIGHLDVPAVAPRMTVVHPDGGVHTVVDAMIAAVRAGGRVAPPEGTTQKMKRLL